MRRPLEEPFANSLSGEEEEEDDGFEMAAKLIDLYISYKRSPISNSGYFANVASIHVIHICST